MLTMNVVAICVVLLWRLSLIRTQPVDDSSDNLVWTHHAVLDNEGKVQLFWLPGIDDITFEIQVETKGWVGLGFSPDGTMVNSDIVVGWVINNEPTLQDRFATGHTVPEMDSQQDYKLLKGFENETHTILRFQRKYNTCDQKDHVITNDTMRVIYAYHQEDPQQGNLMQHQKEGSRSLFLVGFNNNINSETKPNTQAFEMRVPNITLPMAEKSFCWRKLFKFTPTSVNDVVVGFQPIWNMELAGAIDHIWLYHCDVNGSTTTWDQHNGERGYKCYAPETPSEYTNCTRIIASATAGSMGTRLPSKSGYSFGQNSGESVYLLLEVAYSNWKLQATNDIHDSSGLAMIYTSETVPYQASTLTVGHTLGMSQIIPLDQLAFASMGYCDGEYTKKALPTDGIFVYEVFIQSKIYGKKIVLRHLRNGTEMPPMAKDELYDPKAQIYRIYMDPVHVMPGDNFILECTYDTKQAQTTILGGTGEDNEACLAYLNYFPRTDLLACESSPPLTKLFQWLGTKQSVDVEPTTYQELADNAHNTKFVEYLKYYNWVSRATEFQNIMREEYTAFSVFRGQGNGTVSEPRQPPKVINPFYVHDQCSGSMPATGTIIESNNTMDHQEFPWPADQSHPELGQPEQGHPGHDHGSFEPSVPANPDDHNTMMGDHSGHDNMPMPEHNDFVSNNTVEETTTQPNNGTDSGLSRLQSSSTVLIVMVLSVALFKL